MPLHTLPEGRQIIAGLAQLGRALGYAVEEERPIGESGAAVDLAWYAAGDAGVPLMIFEVESSATASMANNAMKVLSRDADDFIKPLFFFHVLLSGGPENDRIAGLRRQWGSHNYRVYRLNEDPELLRLVRDVFSQHRRISNKVDVSGVAETLLLPPWSRLERPAVLWTLEGLDFDANYLASYAYAGIKELDLRREYLRRLKEIHDGGERRSAERYDTYLGDGCPNILDIAVLVAANIIPEPEAAACFEKWQTSSGYMRTVGPYFGLSRDYDQYVMGIAPFIYGVAGLLMSKKGLAYAWLVDDLYSILREGRERWGFGGNLAVPTALWLAHLASAGMDGPAVTASPDGRERLLEAYSYASDVINDDRGIPEAVIDSPPPCIDFSDLAEWDERLDQPGIALPAPASLNARYDKAEPDDLWKDAIGAALALVCHEDWPTWETRGLVIALRA